MSHYIIKIQDQKHNKDYYLLWSTVVDAPITWGMSLDEFKEFYKEEYGNKGMKELPERLGRVERTGCSAFEVVGDTLASLLSYNRAGKNETRLNKEGILDNYCRNHAEWLKEKS